MVTDGDKYSRKNLVASYSIPKGVRNEFEADLQGDELMERTKNKTVYARESEYQRKRFEISLDEGADGDMVQEKKRRLDESTAESQPSAVAKKSRWDVVEAYQMPETSAETKQELSKELVTEIPGVRDLDFFKPSDKTHFGELLETKTELTENEEKDRQFLRLLLRVKNGRAQTRKLA